MREHSSRPGLRPVESRESPHIDLYYQKLHEAIQIFGITDRAFSSKSKENTIAAGIRILSGLQINPEFFHSPSQALYVLAVADTWIGVGNGYEEKKGLLNVIKELARDEEVSHSGTVRRASQAGRLTGRRFDPQAMLLPEEDSISAWREKLSTTISQYHDKIASATMQELLNATGEGTILNNIRTFLGNDGKPIQVVVLDLTRKEMMNLLDDLEGCVDEINGQMVLVLPKDAPQAAIEHESMHILLPQPNEGFLMQGLVEAWVEAHTSNPDAYDVQREVLARITHNDPELSNALDNTFRDESEQANQLFLRLLINRFGLRGLLAIARLDPGNFDTYGIGLPSEKVQDEFDEITGRINFARIPSLIRNMN